jgi:hypothetical protein
VSEYKYLGSISPLQASFCLCSSARSWAPWRWASWRRR